MQWLNENQHMLIHGIGILLLCASELLGLRKDPGKAKGLIDAVLQLLKSKDDKLK